MDNKSLDQLLNHLMEYSFKYGKGEISSSENPPLLVARDTKRAILEALAEEVKQAMTTSNKDKLHRELTKLYQRTIDLEDPDRQYIGFMADKSIELMNKHLSIKKEPLVKKYTMNFTNNPIKDKK